MTARPRRTDVPSRDPARVLSQHVSRPSRRAALALSIALGAASLFPALPARAETVLRAVMNSDLKIIDPIFTPAYISRNHGYMVYDTLFATDEKGEVQPQMVDTYKVSDDKLLWSFRLRDGLLFHDGKPVTSEDVIASLERWSAKDAMGGKLFSFVDEMKAVDERNFTIKLKSPTGLMLLSLGKPSSTVPFIMPKRIAETPPGEQIKEAIGSGPFVFVADEWKPGDKAVYRKFDKYKPRSEKASGLAGGKVVHVDRVEWRWIPDQLTASNALIAGEIDFIEQPLHEMLPKFEKAKDVAIFDYNPLGMQYTMRFNVLHKPFDNAKIREAALYAFAQEDFLQATIGDEKYWKTCKAMFVCGSPLASDKGTEGKYEGNVKKARELLKEAGYDGTPVVLLHSTDLKTLTNLAPVAKDALEKAGFKVDMQSSDWQTVVARRAKKEAPNAGGYHAMFTAWAAPDVLNPISTAFLATNCDKATFGWPCDEEIEKLRDAFARETDAAKQKDLAIQIQTRAQGAYPTHALLGQWYQPIAHRKSVTDIVKAPVAVLWNLKKSGN